MLRNRYQALSTTERRAFWVSLAISVIFIMFTLTLISDIISSSSARARLVNLIPVTIALIAIVTTWLIFIGRSVIGAWLLQLGVAALLITSVTQSEGLGLSSAFILLAITLYLPVQILSGRSASLALGIGIVLTIGIITLDTFWTAPRISISPDDVLIGTILSVILAFILASTTIMQFRGYTIRTKILVISLGAGLISIISVAVFTTISIRQTLINQTYTSLSSAAEQAIEEVDTYIQYNLDALSAEAQNPQVIGFLQSSFGEQRLNQDAMVEALRAFAQRDPEHIVSYTLLDNRSDGLVVADTEEFNIGFSETDQDYFAVPRFTGGPFVSPVRYSTDASKHEFHIGVPVKDADGKFLGVLAAHFYSVVLNEIIASNNELAGEDSYGILLDEYNIILAHGTNPDWVSHTPGKPSPDVFTVLQNEKRILRNIGGANISLEMPDFSQKLQNVTPARPYFTSTDPEWGTPVEIGVAESKNTPLRLVYVQPQSTALAAVYQQQRVVVTTGIVTGVILLFLVFLVSRTVTDPLVNLATVAEDIASGNLSARAQYEIDDELGTLAKAFNRMTSQLQDTLGGLERRVAERTADLDLARLLSEKRAQDLQSISEISRTISTEQRLEILLPLITRLVSERFDFYHVGIFFVDEARRYAYLQAANSVGGQRMLARGHRLELGTGLVGTVALTGKSRIALDVGADASFFNNPDLPDTHSEMVLPLTVRTTTIGALDVQSTKPGAFTESDANTLGILADQIAIAIENARLFSQTQQARDEAEELYAQVLSREWSAFVKQEEKIGYQKTAIGGNHIVEPIETEEIREALDKGQIVILEGEERSEQPSIAVPVKLRGKTIGVLNIKAPIRNRRWNRDEINLAQAVSDRLALALDNVRLLQESQRRAAKEAKIGEVTAKIGASINMSNVLQTAVEELGRALPGSEVMIQFQSDEEN